MSWIRIGVAATSFLLGACAAVAVPPAVSTPVVGYLPKESLAGGQVLLPPPAAGSPAQAADDAAFREALRLRGSARWDWAIRDATVDFPDAASRLSCALGLPIDPESTPHLYLLVRRSFVDGSNAGVKAKTPFNRTRPFVAGNHPICTPAIAEPMRTDPSYPSGFAAIGWAWALILAELAPERVGELMRRGHAYGESRLVCGAHWESDLVAGRLLGSAVVAQLHSNAEFRQHLEAARAEVAATRARGAKPTVDCAAEARALGY